MFQWFYYFSASENSSADLFQQILHKIYIWFEIDNLQVSVTLHYLIALQYGISVIGWKILKNKRGGYYIGLFGHYIKNHV